MRDGCNDVFSCLPSRLVEKLMPFQGKGVQFAIGKNGRCLIADEMGLGKTLQAIAIAYYYKSEWPLLIIVPSSLKFCWVEELEKWLPDIHPQDIFLVQTSNDANGIQDAKICIVTFGLLSKSSSKVVQEALMGQNFQVVIVDESHYIRNFKTVSCKAIVPLIKNANRRLLLSGTPSLSRPVELYPQIDAICPGEFGTWWNYTGRYCDAKIEFIGKIRRRSVSGASNLEELQRKLSKALMIRRMKDDVLTQLPPKQRQRVLFDLKDSDLKKDLQKSFDELKSALSKSGRKASELLEPGRTDSSVPNTLPMIQKLYQLSGEAKIGPARDYVEMLCQNQNLKFLLFAYHRAMMNGIQQTLMEKNVKFVRIDGDTHPAERQMCVHQFQSDPETKVAILSILAAGVVSTQCDTTVFHTKLPLLAQNLNSSYRHGLTFTQASLVVFAEMYWTPGVLIQCEDRAHRIGQTSCVSVHYLVARNTIDEWIWSALCKKTIVTTTTLNGRRQQLKAEKGHKYQVELLSKAEAYVPPSNSDNNDVDLQAYFSSQQPKDQLSILDFLTSSKKRKSSSQNNNSMKKKKRKYSGEMDDSIVISDEECCASETKEMDKSSISLGSDTDLSETDTNSQGYHRTADDTLTKNSETQQKKSKLKLLTCSTLRSEDADDFITTTRSHITPKTKMTKSKSAKHKMAQTSCTKNNTENKVATQWNCPSCTFLNHADLPFCEVCDAPRKSGGHVNKGKDHQMSLDVGNVETSKPDEPALSGSSIGTSNQRDQPGSAEKTGQRSNDIQKVELDSPDCLHLHAHVNDHCEMIKSSPSCDVTERENFDAITNNEKSYDSDVLHRVFDKPKKKVRRSFQLDTFTGLKQTADSECEKALVNEVDTCKSSNIVNTSQNDQTENVSSQENDESSSGINGVIMEDSVMTRSLQNSNGELLDDKNSDCDMMYSPYGTEIPEPREINQDDFCDTKSEDTTWNCGDHMLESKLTVDRLQTADSLDDKSQGKQSEVDEDKERLVDLSDIQVYKLFKYCCSRYTGRVYLFDQENNPLNINFLPMDIELANHDNFPDLLLHPHNLRIVQRFTREWSSLTETKKRVIIKSSQVFVSPLCLYEQIKSGTVPSVQRHRTKEDTAVLALAGAQQTNGSVRQLSKYERKNQVGDNGKQDPQQSKGILQAINAEGVPLCLHCSKPYTNDLLQRETITSADNAWVTRFCSQTCMDSYWLKTNSQYCRDKVFEAEHGVCQICHFDAHSFYKLIRDTPSQQKRAELLQGSVLNILSTKQKKQIVEHPVAGQFWHADHIRPVWEGGGVCDIDNFRTLCVVCHQKVTADQAKKRAQARRLEEARGMGDITAFFKVAN